MGPRRCTQLIPFEPYLFNSGVTRREKLVYFPHSLILLVDSPSQRQTRFIRLYLPSQRPSTLPETTVQLSKPCGPSFDSHIPGQDGDQHPALAESCFRWGEVLFHMARWACSEDSFTLEGVSCSLARGRHTWRGNRVLA